MVIPNPLYKTLKKQLGSRNQRFVLNSDQPEEGDDFSLDTFDDDADDDD